MFVETVFKAAFSFASVLFPAETALDHVNNIEEEQRIIDFIIIFK